MHFSLSQWVLFVLIFLLSEVYLLSCSKGKEILTKMSLVHLLSGKMNYSLGEANLLRIKNNILIQVFNL